MQKTQLLWVIAFQLQPTCMSDARTESTIAEPLAEIRQVGREVLLLVESECVSHRLDAF
jgi:hypothetical protein